MRSAPIPVPEPDPSLGTGSATRFRIRPPDPATRFRIRPPDPDPEPDSDAIIEEHLDDWLESCDEERLRELQEKIGELLADSEEITNQDTE